jgi:hypothetical protein
MRYLWVLLLTLGVAGFVPAQTPVIEPAPALPVMHAAHPPAIDGVLDNIWENNPWYRDYIYPSGATTFNDAALSWRAMWNADYLYLFISIVDDIFIADDQVGWKDDSVELWLDGDNSKAAAYDGVNDLGYGFVYSNDPENPLIFNPGSEWRMGTTGHLQGAAYTELGVDLELAIPMANLGVVPAPGHLMGIDLDWNDDDDGLARDTKVKYFDMTDNSWQYPNLMGTIELMDRTVYDYADIWYTNTPVVVDGVPDDLSAFPTFVLNHYMGSADSLKSYNDDLALSYQAVWDENNLYYTIRVKDDVLMSDGVFNWQDDGIELWWDGDNSKGSAYDFVNDMGLQFPFMQGHAAPLDSLFPFGGGSPYVQFDPAQVPFASSYVDGEVVLEIAFPHAISGIQPDNGWKFGQEIDWNDSDTPGKDRDTKCKTYAHEDNTWNTPAALGTGMLMGGPGQVLPEPEAPMPVDKFAAKVVPVIDGEFDTAWNNTRLIKVTKNVTGTPPDDWWDSFGNARMAWDAKNFYMFIEVHDDTIVTSATDAYNNDSVELYFDGNNSKNPLDEANPWAWPPTPYDEDDDQIRFVYDQAPTAMVGNFDVSGIDYAYKQTDTGWNLEFLMPWKGQPTKLKAAAGKLFGLEIQINDNDATTREHNLKWWATNDEGWHAPSEFGTAVWSSREVGPVADIHYTAYPIKIDADEDYGWKEAPPIFGNLRMGSPIKQMLDSWDDLEVTWKALWDYTNLYFLIDVIDDTLVQDGEYNWKDDGVELWIDGDASQKKSYDGINDWGFAFKYDPTDIFTDVTNWPGDMDSTGLAQIVQAQKLTGNGLVLEVAFPLALLGIEPGYGTSIGLEVDYNDDDDGGTRDIKGKSYDATDNTWQNPSLLGLAKFVGSVVASEVEEVPALVVRGFGLAQNYPNPFNPVTTIEYSLPADSRVTLDVYNLVGQKVATLVNGKVSAGSHTVQFDASSLSSGIYVYRLQTADRTIARKLTFLK